MSLERSKVKMSNQSNVRVWYVKVYEYTLTWNSNTRRYMPEHFTGKLQRDLGPFTSKAQADRAEHIVLAGMHCDRNRPIVKHSEMMKFRMSRQTRTDGIPRFAIVTHVFSSIVG